ncbi:MAG: (2Fe-2S)-binding protein [Oligoflexia bacterium]|nr:(2Fe-2S)-binding protein [Oligoflexia bacterium]
MAKEKLPAPTIVFKPGKKPLSFEPGETILEIALRNEIPINHSCGGMGSCTTCRIWVEAGEERLKPPEDVEAEHSRMRGWGPKERLACQVEAVNGLVVKIPEAKGSKT